MVNHLARRCSYLAWTLRSSQRRRTTLPCRESRMRYLCGLVVVACRSEGGETYLMAMVVESRGGIKRCVVACRKTEVRATTDQPTPRKRQSVLIAPRQTHSYYIIPILLRITNFFQLWTFFHYIGHATRSTRRLPLVLHPDLLTNTLRLCDRGSGASTLHPCLGSLKVYQLDTRVAKRLQGATQTHTGLYRHHEAHSLHFVRSLALSFPKLTYLTVIGT